MRTQRASIRLGLVALVGAASLPGCSLKTTAVNTVADPVAASGDVSASDEDPVLGRNDRAAARPGRSVHDMNVDRLVGTTPARSAPAQPTPIEAERMEPTRIQAGVGLLASGALGDFGKNVEGAGGLSGHLDVRLGDSVVSVGGEAAYLWYGDESRKVPLSPAIPDLPGVVVTVNTENAMVLVHGRVRAQTRRGRWRPYVDGLFGFTDIFTTTSIAESSDCDAPPCTSGIAATNLEDVVLSFGGGVGVMVAFGSPPRSARLDVSVRYLRGGEADYLTEGAIRREGGQASLDISRSGTDMVTVYIGVAFGR